MLIAPDAALGPDDGALLGLKGIAAALIGGLVSLRLALLGGLALGVLEAFAVAWEPLGGRWGDVIALALLVVLAARRWRARRARPRPRRPPPRPPSLVAAAQAVTDLAFDLYLLAAALGLVPTVAYAGMPVLAQSAFLALGAVGAMQLERAGLSIGSAVLVSILAGGALGALPGGSWRSRPARGSRSRRGAWRGSRPRSCSRSRSCPAARRA